MKKKNILILSIILSIHLIVGVVIAGIFNFRLEKSEWITLITSLISTFAVVYLGYMVFFQTENHRKRQEEAEKEHEKQERIYYEEQRKNREQDLIIRTAPYVSFERIEFAETSNTIAIAEDSSACLKYYENSKDRDKTLSDDEFSEKYQYGNLFRFIFCCPQDKGLQNILFKEVSVYPEYPDTIRKTVEKRYFFANKKAKINDKTGYEISYIGNDKYQICKYFMFPVDDFLHSDIAEKFESELLTPNSRIFFNIQYETINIYNVKIDGELKFFTTASADGANSNIIFTEPTCISNWVGYPELMQTNDDKK